MTLPAETRRRLHHALVTAFPDRSALERMLFLRLEVNLNELVGDRDLSTIVSTLIRWAEAQGRLEELIAAALADNPRSPELLAFQSSQLLADLDSANPAPSPPADVVFPTSYASVRAGSASATGVPYAAYLLPGNRPFLDRNWLREQLERLATRAADILLVNGPTGSGKTYSAELIFHVAAALDNIRVLYLTAADAEDVTRLTPHRVGQQLSRLIPEDANWPAGDALSSQVLSTWLVGAFTRSPYRWWVVLDGFDRPGVPSETHDLVRQLMIGMSAPGRRGSLSLILLGFDSAVVPVELQPYVLHDDIGPPTDRDVHELFLHVLQDWQVPVAESQVAEIVEAVMSRSPEGGMRALNLSIQAALGQLRR